MRSPLRFLFGTVFRESRNEAEAEPPYEFHEYTDAREDIEGSEHL
jgi:hypothetical protein